MPVPDMTALGALLTSFKVAKDIAQAMVGLRDVAAFQSKMVEFQSAILDAQGSAFAANDERSTLVEEVSKLKTKVAKLEAWNAEKKRYQLEDIGLGSLAYVVKERMRGTEPPHQICAACYQHRKKSILQPRDINHDHMLLCPECKTQLKVGDIPYSF